MELLVDDDLDLLGELLTGELGFPQVFSTTFLGKNEFSVLISENLNIIVANHLRILDALRTTGYRLYVEMFLPQFFRKIFHGRCCL